MNEKFLPENFALPARTVTGKGRIKELADYAAEFGGHGLLVHGASLQRSGMLSKILAANTGIVKITPVEYGGGEPTLDDLDKLLKEARAAGVAWIAAIGGGSVLDLAKACAGLLHAPGAPVEYHDGRELAHPAIPFLAAPTTAGTGSEATINSVLINLHTGIKKSIRHPKLMPRVVILDAELLLSCPPEVRAHAGLDALTQAIEAYVCRDATWLSDCFARQAFQLLAESLEQFCKESQNTDIAEKMLFGSYFAGLALSLARLGVVHGLAHPLGARYHVPHGQICGLCLPLALELNREAMGERYLEMSHFVGVDLLDWVRGLLVKLAVKNPFANQSLRDADAIIEETLTAGTTKTNPRTIAAADVRWMLERLFAS